MEITNKNRTNSMKCTKKLRKRAQNEKKKEKQNILDKLHKILSKGKIPRPRKLKEKTIISQMYKQTEKRRAQIEKKTEKQNKIYLTN